MATLPVLAQLADHLATEPSRLKKRAAIAAAIRSIATETPTTETLTTTGLFAQYLAGQPFAASDPRKLNTGAALLTRALKSVANTTDAALTAAYRRHGDLGAAAFDLLAPNTQPPLTLPELADAFHTLATARTTAIRLATVTSLLRRCQPLDAKYLLKLLLGDMRIGVKQSLIEEAIAIASDNTAAEVRHAVMLEADLPRATLLAFTHTLTDARMRLFHPLGFMLASPVETPEEAILRFTPKPTKPELSPSAQDAFIEDKYDGMRAQIHCDSSRVAIYSRNQEDITASFPELAEAFANISIPLILDGEILAWDIPSNKALPFATLGQRIGRKLITNDLRRKVPVIFMAFDILFHVDTLLLNHPLSDRRHRLEALTTQLSPITQSPLDTPTEPPAQQSLFGHSNNQQPTASNQPRLHLSPSTLVTTASAIDAAYNNARARANEGVMLKSAASIYQPGRRGLAWLKLKRELATLDVVITAAEFGHGRRAGLLSDYTFAVQDTHGNLLNVGKAYSGLTDIEIADLTTWLKAHTLEDHGHSRTVEPLRILEVAFNNIMRSDRHASGFALRFPRILRIRDDKPLTEIDTLARVEEIYLSQPDRPIELHPA